GPASAVSRDASSPASIGRRPPIVSSRHLQKFGDGVDHGRLLSSGQLAEDWQREAGIGGALRVRKIAAAVAEVCEAALEVERDGIVDFVSDAALVEMPLQRVAIGRLDDELIVDVAV